MSTLKKRIYDKLSLIRIYPRRKSAKKELQDGEKGEPMIIKAGSTVAKVCEKIHKDLKKEFKYATIIGRSVKFPNQRVGLDHVVIDGDMITIISK